MEKNGQKPCNHPATRIFIFFINCLAFSFFFFFSFFFWKANPSKRKDYPSSKYIFKMDRKPTHFIKRMKTPSIEEDGKPIIMRVFFFFFCFFFFFFFVVVVVVVVVVVLFLFLLFVFFEWKP